MSGEVKIKSFVSTFRDSPWEEAEAWINEMLGKSWILFNVLNQDKEDILVIMVSDHTTYVGRP